MVLDIIILLNGIFLVILILLQQRGGSLGTFFGFSGSLNFTQRRGLEKYFYHITWFLAILFLGLSYLRIVIF
ncbi:MAG: preprotein translocase subunit SecG [Patescibacteria group bacterium]|nr:preprotein translocase subunit SecG [Patescibacteria group bacterium]